MTNTDNKLAKLIKKINWLPESFRPYLITKAFCSKVKFAGTSKIWFSAVSKDEVVVELKNRKRVQNHIGGIHAIAAAVVAESATGMVFGMNLSDRSLPLLKSISIDYNQRMQGDIKATATLTSEQKQQLIAEEKGSIEIPVVIEDDSGQQPITCTLIWAWVPKKK